jgi:hypothetical protein
MVRADIMDGIDYSLRINRANDQHCGGVQIILMGDLFQLPPVVRADTKGIFEKKYASPYFLVRMFFKRPRFAALSSFIFFVRRIRNLLRF